MTSASRTISFGFITNGKRAKLLTKTISLLKRQLVSGDEVIVAGRVPETVEGADVIIHCPDDADAGRLGAMRNTIVQRSRNGVIVMADDDIRFATNFADTLRHLEQNFDALAVGLLNPDGSRHWGWGMKNSHEHRFLRLDETHADVYLHGGLCVLRKSVAAGVRWDELKGFYQEEDVDFSRRLKAQGFRITLFSGGTATHMDSNYTSLPGGIVRISDLTFEQLRAIIAQKLRLREPAAAWRALRTWVKAKLG